LCAWKKKKIVGWVWVGNRYARPTDETTAGGTFAKKNKRIGLLVSALLERWLDESLCFVLFFFNGPTFLLPPHFMSIFSLLFIFIQRFIIPTK